MSAVSCVAGGVEAGSERFAVGGYGGVRWLRGDGRTEPALEIGATATLAVTASPDGNVLAVGCLDKRLRLFSLLEGAAGTASTQTISTIMCFQDVSDRLLVLSARLGWVRRRGF